MKPQPIYGPTTGWRHKAGTLAFFDSFAGLVPVKVTEVPKGGPYCGWLISEATGVDLAVVVTATRGTYKRGERLKLRPHLCVPRSQVVTRGGQYRIRTNYSWTD